ncbi:hypothetical protein ACJRO7_018149 [Eucalyptus globulus]|uniref:MATH domain-containing protein n=1 Tax=Eucalyptus globulus TaxID=34317 RepID=A0ABD3KTR0_EUCGL
MPPKVEQATARIIRLCDPEHDDELPRRNRPPVHYELEINSVEELLELGTYESGVFDAGGYEWSLCLHLPRGPDGKVDDKGHMSLYLSMEESNRLGDGEKIVVDYKFFAFDYNSWNYVIFTEKGKELRTFSKAKTELVLPKFLSLKKFKEPKNGYLKDDHCIFGAEGRFLGAMELNVEDATCLCALAAKFLETGQPKEVKRKRGTRHQSTGAQRSRCVSIEDGHGEGGTIAGDAGEGERGEAGGRAHRLQF